MKVRDEAPDIHIPQLVPHGHDGPNQGLVDWSDIQSKPGTFTPAVHGDASHSGLTAPTHSNEAHANLTAPSHDGNKHVVPYCALKFTTNQSIANNTNLYVAWNTEVSDLANLHDNATDNTRITVPAGFGGLWLFTWTMEWQAVTSVTNCREITTLNINRTTHWARCDGERNVSTSSTFHNCVGSAVVLLVAGDYAEIEAYQGNNVGGARNVIAGDRSRFEATHLGIIS